MAHNFNKLNRSITWITFEDGSSVEISGMVSGFQFDLDNNLTLSENVAGYKNFGFILPHSRTAKLNLTLSPGFTANFFSGFKPKWYKHIFKRIKRWLFQRIMKIG
jgi:hypothetical protein